MTFKQYSEYKYSNFIFSYTNSSLYTLENINRNLL